MARKFKELQDKLSSESQQRIDERAKEVMKKMVDDDTPQYMAAIHHDPVERAKLQALAPNYPLSPPHADAIVLPCAGCGAELSVGPKLQEAMRIHPHAQVMCIWCLLVEQRKLEKQGIKLTPRLAEDFTTPSTKSNWDE